MNRRSTVHALFALGAATIVVIALAADDQPVRPPYVEPGDCWSYRAGGIGNRGAVDYYKVCITFVDSPKNLILAVATANNDGREIDVSFTTEWNLVAAINGRIFTPAVRAFKFPLQVGDMYSSASDFREALKGANAGKVTWNIKVVGWEDITVPAGTFHALKIEGSGSIERYDRPMKFPSSLSYWYVPEVNRYVKYQFKTQFEQLTEELTEYQLKR